MTVVTIREKKCLSSLPERRSPVKTERGFRRLESLVGARGSWLEMDDCGLREKHSTDDLRIRTLPLAAVGWRRNTGQKRTETRWLLSDQGRQDRHGGGVGVGPGCRDRHRGRGTPSRCRHHRRAMRLPQSTQCQAV